MKTALILGFILLLLSFHSEAQQTIDKLNTNQLKLPKESVSKALILDATGQVKSSSVTDTEVSYLSGLTDTINNLLNLKANDSDVVKLTGNQSVGGIKTLTGKLVASSTTNGSIPCPVMTQSERDLLTPSNGECVYNSTSLKLNIYDGSIWKDVGGAGGISMWVTANGYVIDDIVIESNKIYKCLVAHTSGTFATDLSSGKWVEVSSGLTAPVQLADGGTNKAITPSNGSIVWVDADSFEVLAAGVSGQVLQSNGASSPSWVNKSISAKAGSNASVIAEEIQVRNNLLTSTATNKHLIEVGNKNILINPGFEHSTFSTGWTNSGVATPGEETTTIYDGAKSLSFNPLVETVSLKQVSTLNSSNLGGTQGLASVRVKSNYALKVCAVIDNVVSTTLCVDVQANNKWGLYKVPFIMGSTSSGISIASTGNVPTANIYIDDAFVGAVDLTQNSNACQTTDCETNFTASINASDVVSGENLDWIVGDCTDANVGRQTCTFKTGLFTVTPNCVATAGPIGGSYQYANIYSVSSTSVTIEIRRTDSSIPINNQSIISCSKQGADFTAAKQLSNGNTYSSTNADTDWASCGHTTSSFTGFGTVSAIETQCKRQGADLLMRGKFTGGTSTAVEARLSLPVWNGVQLVSAGASVIPSIQISGIGRQTAASAGYFVDVTLMEPSVSYLTFGQATSTTSGVAKLNGSAILASGNTLFINAKVPIEGWQNSNIIIGQFNGLESCSSTLDCTDTFSAFGSNAAVISQENVDFINANGTVATGVYTYTFKSGVFTVAPNCFVSVGPFGTSVGNYLATINTITSSSISFNAIIAGTATAFPHQIICQKHGVDYVGKTAKAVASDQNLRSPGVTKAVFYSAGLTSAGVPLIEIGDFLNGSCTCATGVFSCSFNTNTWASTPSCQITNPSTRDRTILYPTESTSSLSFTVQNTAGTGICEAVKISCHGVSP